MALMTRSTVRAPVASLISRTPLTFSFLNPQTVAVQKVPGRAAARLHAHAGQMHLKLTDTNVRLDAVGAVDPAPP